MRTVGYFGVVLMLLSYLGLGSNVATAQDQPPAKKAPKVATSGDPVAEFKKLIAIREELGDKLSKLQEQIEAARKANDQKKFKALVDQFNGEIAKFQQDVLPSLLATAQQIYLKDPNNPDAASVIEGYLGDLYGENRYKEVAIEANKYLEADNNKPIILNLAGISRFAIQDFAGATELLTRAQEAKATGKETEADRNLRDAGAKYLDDCKPYAKFWETEQAIRAKEAAAQGENRLPRVLLQTTKGPIEVELFENEAPNTVANFISLVEKKFYDGIVFHRVLPNFMAQVGDPNTKDPNADPRSIGSGGPGYHIACECYKPNARMHFQGSLSMAHAGKDSGGSQFFLTHLPTPHLNPNPAKSSGHTVFGRVVKGMNIELALRPGDKIESATVLFKRNHPYVPKTLRDNSAVQEKE